MLCCFNAGEDVVFICNDWHTALLPCYLKAMYQSRGIYKSAKVMRGLKETTNNSGQSRSILLEI